MTLHDALKVLERDPGDTDANAVLAEEVHRRAQWRTRDPYLAEELAQEVLLKLVERLHSRLLVVQSSGEGLVNVMLDRTLIDLLRGRKQPEGLEEDDPEQNEKRIGPTRDTPPNEPVIDLLPLLLRACQHALVMRAPRNRESLARGLAVLRDNFELLVRRADDPSLHHLARMVTRDATYYQQQHRAREALFNAIDDMARKRHLDEAEAMFLQEFVSRLVYCQKAGT